MRESPKWRLANRADYSNQKAIIMSWDRNALLEQLKFLQDFFKETPFESEMKRAINILDEALEFLGDAERAPVRTGIPRDAEGNILLEEVAG